MKEFKEEELPEEFKKEFDLILKDLIETSELKDLNKISFEDLFTHFRIFGVEMIRNKDKLKKFLDIIPKFYMNLDKFFIHTEAINKDHYIDIINILNIASQEDKTKTINICREYFQSLETKYPFWKITNNLLIFRDFSPNFYRLISSTPLNKFSEEFTKILFKMIENHQEEEFYNYFFDWILKYGYLIEAYIKEYLIFLLKIRCLLNNEDFNKIFKKNRTVGRLLKILKTDESLGMIRNAIFHTTFILDYKVDLDHRKVIFKDLKDRDKEFKIEDFVGIFFKLYQFIQTEQLALSFFMIKIYEKQLKSHLSKILDNLKKELKKQGIPEKPLTNDEIDKIKMELKKILKNAFRIEK